MPVFFLPLAKTMGISNDLFGICAVTKWCLLCHGVESKKKENQRTNGPVNAHLISGPSKSTKQTKPGNKYEKDLINNTGS